MPYILWHNTHKIHYCSLKRRCCKEEEGGDKEETIKAKTNNIIWFEGLQSHPKYNEESWRKQYKKVEEFIRAESSPNITAGIFKYICDDFLRQFENKQGLVSYRDHCETAITKQAKDKPLYM